MTKICLCLTGKTIERNLEVLSKYQPYIDLAELRVDYLDYNEQFYVRKFPSLAGVPIILTIRRKVDGGNYERGESSRIVLLSKALAYAQSDRRKNFAYVDLEEDLDVPGLEDASRAFGTRIIRSFHDFTGVPPNIAERIRSLSHVGDEIVKAAVMINSCDDITTLFKVSKELKDLEKIILGIGDAGSCTRILAAKFDACLTYTSAKYEDDFSMGAPGQLDPKELSETYRFRSINKNTAIYGITGYPLSSTGSPALHNAGYGMDNINAVYVPFPSKTVSSFLQMADEIGMEGASVTVPHKETILEHLSKMTDEVRSVGACNTILRTPNGWEGYNTDTHGFSDSLLNFIGQKDIRWTHITIIGAGGAAMAVAAELHRLKAKVLIVNRNKRRACELAERYNFKWDVISEDCVKRIKKYSNIIIQTTSCGMEPNIDDDPLPYYKFNGKEIVMDIIYKPERTKFLLRAEEAGCRVISGYDMLMRQGKHQYSLFMKKDYPEPQRA
ncbi:3-dehydroquinate dehydratase [Spirochaetia bacterium]|nr:3-dehydroquinate dehydratase [Spirochaetia bacterium]